MFKHLLIWLLLGRKREYFNFLTIRGRVYKIDICPHVSLEELIKSAVNTEILTTQGELVKKEDF